jgi:hypothetical protein
MALLMHTSVKIKVRIRGEDEILSRKLLLRDLVNKQHKSWLECGIH